VNYKLMHKSIPVVSMEVDEVTGSIIAIENVYNDEHLPVGTVNTRGEMDRGSLNKWWIGRSIPMTRSGLRDALEILGVPMPQLLLDKCLGLSLSDQYWICPADRTIQWESINFFDNTFSEDVGDALFGSKPDSGKLNLMSPDNTSDGWLKKKWKIIAGKRCLVKGGSGQGQQEPLNEEIASKIMEKIGTIEYVPYTLVWEDGMPYSVCENFITKETELISAWSIVQTLKRPNHVSEYQHFCDCCEMLGIPNYQDSLNKMLTIDYLIANADRHLNNFGAIRNAHTLEWIGIAPVFDCGTSLFNDKPTSLINVEDEYTPSKPFKNSHEEQIKLITDFSWLDAEKFDGIVEECSEILEKSLYIDDSRREKLCQVLDSRIENLQEIIVGFEQQIINDGIKSFE